jgi:hypothetical protein
MATDNMNLIKASKGSRFQEISSRKNEWVSSCSAYNDGAFHVDLYRSRGGSATLRIVFPDVIFVRVSDEGVRLSLINSLAEAPGGMILLDLNSELLTWLDGELLQTRDLSSARHYIVTAGEEIIDVVSAADPVWIEAALSNSATEPLQLGQSEIETSAAWAS